MVLDASSATSPGGWPVAVCSSAHRLETATVTRNAVAALRGSVARGQKYVSTKVYPGGTAMPTAAARASTWGSARWPYARLISTRRVGKHSALWA